MAIDTIFQSDVATNFFYPFILIFVLVFAILEKSKVLGEGKQKNAMISLVIALIFVSAVFPKVILSNLILFLSLSLVVVFVLMLLWGFVASDKDGFKLDDNLRKGLMALIGIAVVIGVFWAFGVGQIFWDWLFNSGWSDTFWTNLIFVVLISAAIAVVLRAKK